MTYYIGNPWENVEKNFVTPFKAGISPSNSQNLVLPTDLRKSVGSHR